MVDITSLNSTVVDTENANLEDYQHAIDELGLFKRFDHMLRQGNLDIDSVKRRHHCSAARPSRSLLR